MVDVIVAASVVIAVVSDEIDAVVAVEVLVVNDFAAVVAVFVMSLVGERHVTVGTATAVTIAAVVTEASDD